MHLRSQLYFNFPRTRTRENICEIYHNIQFQEFCTRWNVLTYCLLELDINRIMRQTIRCKR